MTKDRVRNAVAANCGGALLKRRHSENRPYGINYRK